MTFYLWKMMKMYLQKVLEGQCENSRIQSRTGSISQRHGSADPDPYQNVTDPQHWLSGKPKSCYATRLTCIRIYLGLQVVTVLSAMKMEMAVQSHMTGKVSLVAALFQFCLSTLSIISLYTSQYRRTYDNFQDFLTTTICIHNFFGELRLGFPIFL